MTEFMPASTRISYIQSPYPSEDRPIIQYQQSTQQAWPSNSFASNSNADVKDAEPHKKNIALMFFIGTLIGLVICGVPLAVIATMYLQQRSSSNGASSSANNTSSTSLPSQCSSYIINIENTRNVGYSCGACYCDSSLTTAWYRFLGAAGTQLATTAVSTGYCGANMPGWFNGSFPTTVGGTTTGTLCVNSGGTLCHSTYSITAIMVTNCDGFYVFYLKTASYCYTRYCTT